MRLLLAATLLAALASSALCLASEFCQDSYKYPAGCEDPDCYYQAIWRYIPKNDTIDFIISSKFKNRWTGIGFARDRSLMDVDAIVAWVDESRYVMMDMYMPIWARPIGDKHQSVSAISATVFNKFMAFRFTRKRDTGDDQQDLAFTNSTCLYFVYPVGGGSVDNQNRLINTTQFQPMISAEPICMRDCNQKAQASSASANKPTTQVGRTTGLPTVSLSTDQTQASVAPTRPPTRQPQVSTSSSTTTSTTTPPPPPPATSTTTTTTTSTTSTTARPTSTRAPVTVAPTSTTTSSPPPSTSTSSTTTSTSSTTTSTTTTSTPAPTTSTSTRSPTLQTSTNSVSSTAADKLERDWCVGRFLHPQSCLLGDTNSSPTSGARDSIKPLALDSSDCTYAAQWLFHPANDSIEFIVQTKTRNRWTGIGFSNSTQMIGADAIIIMLDEHSAKFAGRPFVMDVSLVDKVLPRLDEVQSVQLAEGKRESGVTTFRFHRKRSTADPADFQFSDDSCPYFFFPTHGGLFNAISKRLSKHDRTPIVSKQPICIRSCPAKPTLFPTEATVASQPEQTTASTTPNLLLLATSSVAPVSSTSAPDLSPASGTSSNEIPGKSNGGADVTVNLSPPNDLSAELDGSQSSAPSTSSGRSTSLLDKMSFLSEPSLRWLAGIGCVATLLAIIVFQACFTVYKNKQAYKQNLYRQSAFKQNAYLHGAFMGDTNQHQPSTASDETQTASLQNSTALAMASRTRRQHQALPQVQVQQAARPPASSQRPAKPISPSLHQAQAQQRSHAHPQHPFAARYDDFATSTATESSEPEEEEPDEVEDEEDYEDDLMMEGPFDFPQAHQPANQVYARSRPVHHNHSHGHNHVHRHPYHHRYAHQAVLQAQLPNQAVLHHPYDQSHGHSHRRSTATATHGAHLSGTHHFRAHLPPRSQPHHHVGGHAHPARPDSYFLPSQRRY